MSNSPSPNGPDRQFRQILSNRRALLAAAGLALLVGLGITAGLLIAAGGTPAQPVTSPPVAQAEPTAARPEPTVVPATQPTQQPQPTPVPLSRLAVQTDPPGAALQVDGKERGTTPAMVENLAPGAHQVQLSMAGWVNWQQDVSLKPDETRQLQVSLEKIPEPTAAPSSIPEGPLYPIAIMVENSIDARPQSGLARADLVYEALVEGGITRFMAVYVGGQSDVIGPVRSARHYFAYLAAEHNASYVYIGSSPQGYAALSGITIAHLDETYGDPGFWRVNTRYAPHNAYTSTDLVRSSLDKLWKVTPGSMAGFQFQNDVPLPKDSQATEISLTYPRGYEVGYSYSPEEKVYRRSMDGYAQRDAETGEQVAPRSVVVQYVDAWLIPGDDAGRLDMQQVGQGKAIFFRDGTVTQGYWQKASYGNVTEWYDSNGKPIVFNPGKIWVQIVPQQGSRIQY